MPQDDNLGSDNMAFEGSNFDEEINKLSKESTESKKSKKKNQQKST